MKTSVGTGILIFAIVAYAFVSAAIAFAYQETADNQFPVGTNTVFRVNEIAANASKASVIDAIQTLAVDHKQNIYKISPDPARVDSGRILFAFVGDESAFIGDSETWKYPSFSKSFSTVLLPHSEITTQDMRGLYASDVDVATFAPLLKDLQKAGIGASLERVPNSMIFGNVLFGETSSGPVLIATLVALLLASAFYASRRYAVCSIRYIHGWNRLTAILDEYFTTAKLYMSVILACGAALLTGLYFYNQLTQGAEYFYTVGLLLLGGVVAILVGQTATFLIMARWPTSEIIKGRKPLLYLTVVSVAAQVMTLAVCYPTISAGVQTAASITRDARFDAQWLEAQGFVTVRFSGTNTPEDLQAITSRFGEVARTEEQNDRLVVAKPASLSSEGPAGHGPYTGNSLVVNNRFLREQHVESSQGGRIEHLPETSGRIYLLIPQQLKGQIPAIVGEYTDWAEFQRSLEGTKEESRAPQISVIETAPGQEIFNYGSNFSQTQISQVDPVIAVVPASSGILSNDFYLSAASSGAILFRDTSILQKALAGAAIERHVTSIDSVSDRAMAERNDRLLKARILAVSLLLFVTMLLIVGVVLTRVYFERNRQRLFIEAVHGKRFASMHAEYFLLTGLIAGGVLAAEILLRAVTSLPSFYMCLCAIALFMLATVALTGRQQKALYERFAR